MAARFDKRFASPSCQLPASTKETERTRKALASGRPFDLVVLDLTVKAGLGGKETLKWLLEIDPQVKAIVSSGYSDDPVVADFSRYGFSGILNKLYSIGALRECLDRLLEPDGRKKPPSN